MTVITRIWKPRAKDGLLLSTGRKDMTTIRKQQHIPDHGSTSPEQSPQSLTSRMCRMWQYVYDWTHDVVTGPSTTLEDCMRAFFDTSDLSGTVRIIINMTLNYTLCTVKLSHPHFEVIS